MRLLVAFHDALLDLALLARDAIMLLMLLPLLEFPTAVPFVRPEKTAPVDETLRVGR